MAVNLTTACRVTSTPGKQFMANLKPGDAVGLRYEMDDCEVASNAIVVSVEDGTVMANVARSAGRGRKFLDRPRPPFDISYSGMNVHTPARHRLAVGAAISVIEQYPDGRQCVVAGTVRAVEESRYQVGGIWFDYRPTGVTARIFGGK